MKFLKVWKSLSRNAYGKEELIKFTINKFKNAIDHVSFSTVKNLVIHMFDDLIINNHGDISKVIIKELNSINSFDQSKSTLKRSL